MRRRKLILGLGCAAALPRLAIAQQKTVPVIGWLGIGSLNDSGVVEVLTAFRQGLAQSGYREGDVRIEYRSAEGNYDRLPALAADLVAGKVDLIVNEGGTASALAAKQATSKIPIVFNASDAVAEGLVASLSRPGGNLTGVSQLSPEIWPKLLQMAAELVPRARLVAVLVNPENPVIARQLDVLQQAAGQIGIELSILKAGSEGAIEAVFDRLGGVHADALVVPPDLFFTEHREKLVALAARHRIAAVYGQNIFARTGGLIAYQSDQLSVYRLKGVYAGKILDGAKPADLPVQQPTKFDLVINLKTAKALGLTVPQALLARADEVIE